MSDCRVPMPTYQKPRAMFAINPKAVIAAAGWASKDKSRQVITGLKMDLFSESYRIVATDSYRLVVIEGKCHGEGEASILIDAKSLADQLKKSDNYLIIDADSMVAHAGKSNTPGDLDLLLRHEHRVSVGLRRVDGKYPDWKKLIPESLPKEVNKDGFILNASYLGSAGSLVTDITGARMSAPVHVSSESPTKPVYAWANLNELAISVQMVIMPCRHEEEALASYIKEG